MFDDIPIRVLLLILIVMIAYAPAHYIARHVMHAPSRRDVAAPPENLDWRTSHQFYRSLAIVMGLVALAVFIHTPMAEDVAAQPEFWPTLFAGAGFMTLATLVTACSSGRITPIIRGVASEFDRADQPRLFWTAFAWNAVFGLILLGVAWPMYSDGREHVCLFPDERQKAATTIAACDRLLGGAGVTHENRARFLSARGVAHHRREDALAAMRDYDAALRLRPDDTYALYNRALLRERRQDFAGALADYSASLQHRPDNADALLRRGVLHLDAGRFDDAVHDFTRAHALAPREPFALANRGISYAWLGDRTAAQRDFGRAAALDPSNVVVLRGRALLSGQAGDFAEAVRLLTAALAQDSEDRWSLRYRAAAFAELGDADRADRDSRRLEALNRNRTVD